MAPGKPARSALPKCRPATDRPETPHVAPPDQEIAQARAERSIETRRPLTALRNGLRRSWTKTIRCTRTLPNAICNRRHAASFAGRPKRSQAGLSGKIRTKIPARPRWWNNASAAGVRASRNKAVPPTTSSSSPASIASRRRAACARSRRVRSIHAASASAFAPMASAGPGHRPRTEHRGKPRRQRRSQQRKAEPDVRQGRKICRTSAAR